jgi:type II secretory pathway pseudopilin PulG
MKQKKQSKESGYALLALLAAMTIITIGVVSQLSKPTVRFQSQRENEEEMLYRAELVTAAIQSYAQIKGGLSPQNCPMKLEELLQEYQVPTAQGGIQRLHLIRKSAMTDPITNQDWQPVRLGDPKIAEFYRTYDRYVKAQQAAAALSGNSGPGAAMEMQRLMQSAEFLRQAAIYSGVDLNKTSDDEIAKGEPPTTTTGSAPPLPPPAGRIQSSTITVPAFKLSDDLDGRPIIGVISKSKLLMVKNYYEVASLDKALFVPGIVNPTNPQQGGIVGVGAPPIGTTDDPTERRATGPCLKNGVLIPGCIKPRP